MGLLGSPDSQQERVTLYCLNVEYKERKGGKLGKGERTPILKWGPWG